MTQINVQEWLDALEKAAYYAEDPEAVGTDELAKIWGISQALVRKRLRILLDKGLAIPTSKKRRTIDGRLSTVPAYKLKLSTSNKGPKSRR